MNRKKISLSAQLASTMLMLVAGTFILFWIFNSFFLEKYYLYNKQKELESSFEIMNSECEKGNMGSDSFRYQFERICANDNVEMIIYINQYNVVISSLTDAQKIQFYADETIEKMNGKEHQIISVTDRYEILRTTDRRTNDEYLTLKGELGDGSSIYMRTAMESIRESASITNRFFVLVGTGAIALSLIVIIFMTKRITKPIKEITSLSKRMSNLEFDAKYSRPDYATIEIDELGVHMNELSQTLEETISELKMANNELKQDIKKKEHIDEMRKEFLSNVSHELKTPLALIQGYSEGLKECINDDEESREFYCDVIIDEADKMNKMVKKLLTLNQLEFGNEVVEMTRFNLTELIQGIINSSRLMASQKGVTINFYNSEPLYVWGDEFKVEEVIVNYISNAMNHAEEEKRIDIFCEKRGEILRTRVFNTGKHIPQEDLDKVWVKFYKVDKARTREYGGNGIGLSIVKAIMDSFHQQCGVQNVENGVEFWMELDVSDGR